MTAAYGKLPDVLTAGDLAALFGVDPKTVARWAKAGKLRESFRTPGGHRRWHRAAIEPLLRRSAS